MGFSDSLPAGLTISGDSAPVPVNNCGGTLTAVSGTQLIELKNGLLDASAACTIVVHVTGTKPGKYQNTIPAGALITDSSSNVTNSLPATDTLVITGGSGGGGKGKDKKNPSETANTEFIIPVTGFGPGMMTKLDASSRPTYDSTSLTIQIPVLKVNTSIVGVESKQGSWDVSWLQDQVGWLNGTAYPTWKGNSVLTAHVVNADGKPGVFSKLKSLGLGEYIFVYGAGYRYTYKVVSSEIVQPNDAGVMKHEDKSFLTLITCDSYDAKTGTYLHRVVIGAALVDVRPLR
jgi:LPXTG-site transpeptidase (sortase) family protein